MIDVDDFITLVIHTQKRAQSLKNILESHGIEVRLEDFVSFKSPVTVAQRVKIRPKDLPMSLKITESGEEYSPALIEMKMAGMSGNLLIPVDFSESSRMAVAIGFKLAKRIGVHPVIMHSYVAPIFRAPISDGAIDDFSNEVAEAEETRNVRDIASAKLVKFRNEIKQSQKDGIIPDMKFSTSLQEGVAEEAILEYCKETPPVLVVMATRGVDKKEEELIGSVTAEVLDSCRVPVFTVPEDCKIQDVENIVHLMMFCNLDQHDIITVDALMRMFDYPKCVITLVPVTQRRTSKTNDKIEALRDFFNTNYPTARFKTFVPDLKNFRNEIDLAIPKKGVDLLIVPNKKTNVFSRIFRPTIAHKSLFERDVPMLVIPV